MKNQSDNYWKEKLTSEQYASLRRKGTEMPFTGKFLHENRDGMFICAACDTPLFKSDTKYESGIWSLKGWPSFADAVSSDVVKLERDTSFGMERVEAVCATCGGHLGHVFDDETSPSGQHYCINSASLGFDPKKQ